MEQTANAQHFKRYELLIEYKNLKNAGHCPSGVYIIPAFDNLNEWHGVLFVQGGYYKNGIFKFLIQIPPEYPEKCPIVRFTSQVFHPLVNSSGYLILLHHFSVWRPHKDRVLGNLLEHLSPNKEAFHMYTNDRFTFAKLATQCAEISRTESVLFASRDDPSIIRFSHLTDQKFEDVKKQILQHHDVSRIASASDSHLPSETTR